jgi:hypothetical protein
VTVRTREGVDFEKAFSEASALLVAHLKAKPEVRDLLQELMSSLMGHSPIVAAPRGVGGESRAP